MRPCRFCRDPAAVAFELKKRGAFLTEMHQVRYFLAVARTLNFTRAAEECHVAQPPSPAPIRQLEGELGGDLFRRERPQSQLTELGQRMLPLLKQCYDSAMSARSLASAIKSGEVGSLRLALSQTIDPSLVMPHVVELGKLFKGLELKLYRGNSTEVLAYLKRGDAELVSVPISERNGAPRSLAAVHRGFPDVVNAMHRLANAGPVALDDLKPERFVVRTYCECTPMVLEFLRAHDIDVERRHETGAEV